MCTQKHKPGAAGTLKHTTTHTQTHTEDMYPPVGLLCALSQTQHALVFLNNRTVIKPVTHLLTPSKAHLMLAGECSRGHWELVVPSE